MTDYHEQPMPAIPVGRETIATEEEIDAFIREARDRGMTVAALALETSRAPIDAS